MIAPTPQSDRLRFREYTPADEPRVFAMFADPEARTFYPEMKDPALARRWISWNLENYQTFGYGLWALELAGSGAFVGDCGLTWQDVEGVRQLEIGYHIAREHRRQGYATEAARACLDFALAHTDARLICSVVARSNIASCAVARRVHQECRNITGTKVPTLLFYTLRAV